MGVDGTSGLPTRLDISGVRADMPPAPGRDAARTNPAPELIPVPPTSGWLDIGLAPIRPTCWLDPLNIEVTCCSGDISCCIGWVTICPICCGSWTNVEPSCDAICSKTMRGITSTALPLSRR